MPGEHKHLQRDLARAPQFQHMCPLVSFGCFSHVRTSGQGAGEAVEMQRWAFKINYSYMNEGLYFYESYESQKILVNRYNDSFCA